MEIGEHISIVDTDNKFAPINPMTGKHEIRIMWYNETLNRDPIYGRIEIDPSITAHPNMLEVILREINDTLEEMSNHAG